VAVIGATARPGSVGRALLENLKSYRAPVYPVTGSSTVCSACRPFPKLEQFQITWT
jgi:acyl-CoA synthetase (NDP forming)